MEETLTKDERLVDSRCQREARREGSPRSGNEEDLRKVIDRLGADKGADRYKTRNWTLSQSGTRESCEPYSRRTVPNEHRKRRHNYDFGSSHTRDREWHDQTGSDRAYRQMMRWIADDPTRLAEAQKDMARWKEYLAEAVKNPVFPFFASMTYGNRGPRPQSQAEPRIASCCFRYTRNTLCPSPHFPLFCVDNM